MNKQQANESAVAIIGMAGRFPGAKNLVEFWQNLRDGVESISFLSSQEIESSGVDPEIVRGKNYVKAKGVLDGIELFDASFFGYSPKEAEIMDPQQRIFLECAWEAIEHAGYNAETYRGLIGVYAAASANTYLFNFYPRSQIASFVGDAQIALGNDSHFLATRVSYKLNLRGPSLTVQTACSSSLTAIHLACQSLLIGECDLALAGGVSITVPQKAGYIYHEGGILSPDGHCLAFDARAQGTVSGNGVGIVMLKRLTDAYADGDCIHAIIRATAMNNDGSDRVGYTAPSVNGQARVIADALSLAGIDVETISYLEAHGSGTQLGDSIEIAALTDTFLRLTDKKGYCALGSVKTNIGHLDAAAGVAGLIKTVLALKHKTIPPSLHFEQPNLALDLAKSPFYINTALTDWVVTESPRRAGISSFGIGGTNVHVILEESLETPRSSEQHSWQILLLSAQTETALQSATENLAEHLKDHSSQRLSDIAYTLQVGRNVLKHRQMVLCRDRDDAIQTLVAASPTRMFRTCQEACDRSVIFMFPGLGDQYVNMARDLYQHEPIFQTYVDHCVRLLESPLGFDLRTILYPDKDQPQRELGRKTPEVPTFDLRKMLSAQSGPEDIPLNQISIVQPILFVVEYALARLWMAWGIAPRALFGYSLGEYVAACLSNVISLEDSLLLVVRRAQLIQGLPTGAMLAVPLAEQDVQPLLGEKLSLAALNGPSLSIVAGPIEAIKTLHERLSTHGIACQHLRTISHAFHSQMMGPIARDYLDLVNTFRLKPPTIPYISNVTGTWITAEQATSPEYYVRHLCETVRFADGLRMIRQERDDVLLEIGPGQALSSLAIQDASASGRRCAAFSSIPAAYDQHPENSFLLQTLGKLWLAGVKIDWNAVWIGKWPSRQVLPTYPFERQAYWIGPQSTTHAGTEQSAVGAKKQMEDWFYQPSWKRMQLPSALSDKDQQKHEQRWLVFVDEYGIGTQLAQRLEHEGQEVVRVQMASSFRKLHRLAYALRPGEAESYESLLRELQLLNKMPTRVIHCWGITAGAMEMSGPQFFEEMQRKGFYSLLFLVQTLGRYKDATPIQIRVVSNGQQSAESRDVFYPEKSPLLGLCKVIHQEYTDIACQNIDIVLPQADRREMDWLLKQIIAELYAPMTHPVVAYRHKHRLIQAFEQIRLREEIGRADRLRERGVYLITGGLGKIGLTLAEWLASAKQARLVLTGRSMFPPKDDWRRWLADHDEHDATCVRIKRLLHMEKSGAEILILAADVANREQMQAAITQTVEYFGVLHGVIHLAGIVEEETFATIHKANVATSEQHFHPKVFGTFVLADLLQEFPIDFCFLQSSLSTVLGGWGFAAYAAANTFLDAYACKKSLEQETLWLSLDWDGAATPEQLALAFQRLLGSELPAQVVVSTKDLHTQIMQWIDLAPSQESPAEIATSFVHPRPYLQNMYVAPRNELERLIGETWQRLLGIAQVGIYDNFFALGGHSLLATQVASHIRQELQVEIPLRSFLEAQTVADLALIIVQQRAEQVEEGTVSQLLEVLGHLSDSDVETLLAGGQQDVQKEDVHE
ncbi:MAG: type I polyketide synthase [Ktedonobacteraceae bacterium]